MDDEKIERAETIFESILESMRSADGVDDFSVESIRPVQHQKVDGELVAVPGDTMTISVDIELSVPPEIEDLETYQRAMGNAGTRVQLDDDDDDG